jgi:hypothetical protein
LADSEIFHIIQKTSVELRRRKKRHGRSRVTPQSIAMSAYHHAFTTLQRNQCGVKCRSSSWAASSTTHFGHSGRNHSGRFAFCFLDDLVPLPSIRIDVLDNVGFNPLPEV